MINKTSSKILITGANGFVGSYVCGELHARRYGVRCAIRKSESKPEGSDFIDVGDVGPSTDWTSALKDVDLVVHMAARVHIMEEKLADPLLAYRKVNTDGTERLARQAIASGVKRLVFLSSVKVNGEGRQNPYTETDEPKPEDPYGVSKHEAEEILRKVAAETGLEVVIIRPPLVYGPGVKANFLRLLRVADCGVTLPLGSINNKRSFVYLGNLVDAIAVCMKHPGAAGQTYLVSDGEDVSTPELIRRVALSLGKPARLLPFPPGMLHLAGRLSGNSDAVERLVGSLQVDSSKIRRELGWHPPFTLEQGLKETAEWYTTSKVKVKG